MIQGRLELDIHWDGRRVTGVKIANSRPAASRLLLGRTPDEALALVPRLFSLCRHGQTVAAALALAAAAGREVADPPRRQAVALAAEATQEHLWRLLLDWPELLGLPVDRAGFAGGYRLLQAVAERGGWGGEGGTLADFVARDILGLPPAEWLAMESAGWAPGALGTVVAALRGLDEASGADLDLLPAGLAAPAYYRAVADSLRPGFAQRPLWRGQPVETGALARWRDAPPVAALLAGGGSRLAARVLARGADLARCALEAVADGAEAPPRAGACGPEPGLGFAWVDTARGLLLHWVRLSEGRIADYGVVAPTEWNFHPEGVFGAELVGLVVPDPAGVEQRARLLALALDPCVAHTVRAVPVG